MTEVTATKLSNLAEGQKASVVSLAGGNGFRERISGMGIYIGAELQVLRKSGGRCGSSVVAVGDTRIAIGHGMAEKVLVSAK